MRDRGRDRQTDRQRPINGQADRHRERIEIMLDSRTTSFSSRFHVVSLYFDGMNKTHEDIFG